MGFHSFTFLLWGFVRFAPGANGIASRTGQRVGAIFVIFLLVLVVFKCISIAKRSTTSPKCVYGLAYVLGGMLCWIAAAFLKSLSGYATLAFAFFGFLGIIFGMCIAFIGLREYRGHPEYVQGKKQAIASLILGTAYLLLFFIGLIKGASSRQKGLSGLSQYSVSSSSGTQKTLPEWNFSFKIPAKPWVEIEAEKFNPLAKFAMLRTKPELCFFIVPEKIDPRLDFSLDAMVEAVKANLLSRTQKAAFDPDKKSVVNGLEGIRFDCQAVVSGREFTYCYWLYGRGGYFFQVISFAETKNREPLLREFNDLLKGFSLLKIDAKAVPLSHEFYGVYESQYFHYHLDLRNTAWMKWPEMTSIFVLPDTGGAAGAAWFVVIPLRFGSSKPDSEALNSVFLEQIKIAYPSPSIPKPSPIREQGISGQFFSFIKKEGAIPIHYRVKILTGTEYAYMAAFWSMSQGQTEDTLVKQFFSNLRFARGPVDGGSTLPEKERQSQAILLNNIGVYYNDSELYQKGLKFFLCAADANPSDESTLVNTFQTFLNLKQYKEAVQFAEQYSTQIEKSMKLLGWKAFFLGRAGQQKEACRIYGELFSRGYSDDEDFSVYTHLLAEDEKWPEVEAAFSNYLTNNDNMDNRLLQAEMLSEKGEDSAALRLLLDQKKKLGFTSKISLALIDVYLELDRPKEAREECIAIIQNGMAEGKVYSLKGEAEYALKWYREAKQSYEKALSFDPQNEEIQESIRQISGLLGEGNNSAIKEEIPAVPLPAAVEKRIASLVKPSHPIEYGAYYQYSIQGHSFRRGQTYRKTYYQNISILEQGAVSRFSTLEVEFDPLSEKIFVNRLVVKDKNGKTVSTGNISDYYVTDSGDEEMASHDQTLNIPVPTLEIGSTIEWIFTIEQGGSESFPFFQESLCDSLPVLYDAVFYSGNPREIVYKTANGVQVENIPGGLVWFSINPVVFQWESSQAPGSHFLPTLWVGDGKRNWKGVCSEYLAELQEYLTPDKKVTRLAAEISSGAKTPEEKIMKIISFLQKRITYKAIEFGIRARLPNPVSRVLSNLFGDCKDHSLLLYHMLRAVGIKSSLALVQIDEDFNREIPDLDQFDHMIVYIPDATGGRFVDGTDKGLDPRLTPPLALGGRLAMVLKSDPPQFLRIPAYPHDANRVHLQRDIAFGMDQTRVKERISIEGYEAALVRDRLISLESQNQKEWAETILNRGIEPCDLENIQVQHLHDIERPLVLELAYSFPGMQKRNEAEWMGRLPQHWERYYIDLETSDERHSPFVVEYPFTFAVVNSLRFPTTLSVSNVNPTKENGKGPGFSWEWESRLDGNLKEVEFGFTFVPGEYKSGQYGEYFAAKQRALLLLKGEMALKKKK